MPHTKAIPAHQSELARDLARRLLKEKYNDRQVELASALGVEQGTLSAFLNKHRGAGGKIMSGLMRLAPAEALAITGGVVVDTLSIAREVVARLGKERIAPGDAWALIELIADEVEEPSVADYLQAALAHPRAQALLAATRPRLPTPPPPVDTQRDPTIEPRLLPGARDVRLKVPAKGKPQRPPNVRRTAVSKGNKR
jgi:hypothetical protein